VDVSPSEDDKKHSSYAFGAHFAEVHVDPDTGEVRVTRFVGASAAGRTLNPKTATPQFAGSIVMGIGMALTEESVVDERYGHFVNADLAEYHMPVNRDMPHIDVLLVDETDSVVNPLGVKGLGEIGKTGVAAAVANAVYHATDKPV
jgi:xanthine dehydrogenase YagR molybdenum-binding subunit